MRPLARLWLLAGLCTSSCSSTLVDTTTTASPMHQGSAAPAGLLETGDLSEMRATIHANLIGRKDDKTFPDEDGNELGDRIRFRQVDVDLTAPITNRVDGVVVIGLAGAPVNEFDAELAQAYVRAPNLTLPGVGWPLDLRLGRMRSSFGSTNELRIFELPQPTRPPSLQQYLGFDGYTNTGVQARVGAEGTGGLSLTLELMDNGDIPLAETSGEEAFSSMASVDYGRELGAGLELRAGSSIYRGKQNGDAGRRSHLVGVDLALAHMPSDPRESGSWHLGGEFFAADLDRESGPSARPHGYYLWGQVQVARDWFVGARLDSTETLDEPALELDQYGAYVSWVPTDRLRFAVGYEFTESDTAFRHNANALLFELDFAMGHAPSPPSWTRK